MNNDQTNPVADLKFDLYVDAVGDAATRSRSIISLLMTATFVAVLALLNSIYQDFNWLLSRTRSLEKVYPWITFIDERNTAQDTVYLSFVLPEHTYLPGFGYKQILPREANSEPKLVYFWVNRMDWRFLKRHLLYKNLIDNSTYNKEMPRHIQFRFPTYYLNAFGGVTIPPSDTQDIKHILYTIEGLHVVNREELERLIIQYQRARVDNSLLVKMPILGVTFDVNWLSFISAAAFSIILFLLYYSLSREKKNLRLIFKLVQIKKISNIDFYQLLSMRQVLNIPKSIDEYLPPTDDEKEEISWFQAKVEVVAKKIAQIPLFLPMLVWLLIITHDVITWEYGLAVNPALTISNFVISLLFGGAVVFFTYACWSQWNGIKKIWNSESKKIEEKFNKDKDNTPVI